MKELARNWLDYAKRDLQAAHQLVSTADLAGLVAFHCQQCIEKSFKGLLEFYEQSIPRIHDLITLHQQVNRIEGTSNNSVFWGVFLPPASMIGSQVCFR